MSSFLILGAGYMGAALAEVALEQDHDVTLADNWYLTERSRLAELEREGARVETADIRDRRGRRRACSRSGPTASTCWRRRPAGWSRARPRLHREHERDGRRGAWPRRSRRRAVRSSSTPARCNVYGPGLEGEVAAGPSVRASARPRAPLEDLGRAVPGDVRTRARLRPRDPAIRDRLRAEPRRARASRESRPSSTSSAASRRPASRCRWTTAARRRSASCTSRTPPASCSARQPSRA